MNVTDLPAKWQTKITCTDEHVFEGTQCWHWTGATNGKPGYGMTWVPSGVRGVRGRYQLMHRLMWEMLVGAIPVGLTIDHLCRNKLCCRPDHLEPVTHKVNASRRPDVHKAECANGHAMTAENTISFVRSNGYHARRCRTCSNTSMRRWYANRATA